MPGSFNNIGLVGSTIASRFSRSIILLFSILTFNLPILTMEVDNYIENKY